MKKHPRFCLIGMVIFSLITGAEAQDVAADFFIQLSQSNVTLLIGQQKKIQKLNSGSRNKSVNLVSIGNFAQHQKEGYFLFRLPGVKDKLLSKAIHIETKSDRDFSWSGLLEGIPGTVTLISQNGELFGHIAVDDRKFELYPLGEQLYAIVEINPVFLAGEECAATREPTEKDSINKGENDNARFVDCSKHARILVLYTANAENAVPDINQTANLALHQANDAFRNSGIYGDAYVQAGMAGPFFLDFTETGDIQQDVQSLADISNVQTLRTNHGADLVILLTGNNYSSYGIVQQIGPNNATSFSIVRATAATGAYTFAHELGHLFGARHQQCSIFAGNGGGCDDTAGSAHGYSFNYGFLGLTKRSTVMHQLRDNYSRILYYSNPNINYDGQATGHVSSNFNANQLWNEALTVAAFRTFIGTLSASVDVRVHYPEFKQYTCEAVSICGESPHTFEWRISHDGFNYGSVVSTQGAFTYTNPLCTNIYVWLRIYSSDSQQADKFFTLSHMDEGCEESRRRAENTFVNDVQSTVTAYPNPAFSEVTIKYYLAEAGMVRLSLIDNMGKSVILNNYERLEYGWHNFTINTTGIPAGIYLVKVESSHTTDVSKVAIQR